MNKKQRVATLALCAGMVYGTHAPAAIDNNAETVRLSTSCMENGAPLDNCFTDVAALDSWIWGTRAPSAAAPLEVSIGPGTFDGLISCTDSGYVSFHGAGMDTTVIRANQYTGPVMSHGCTELRFSHMTLQNHQTLFGVGWFDGGTSVWDSVKLDMIGYAWWEGAGNGCQWTPGEHYWLNSIISTRSAAGSSTAYYATCDVSWFLGSELTSTGDAQPGSVGTVRAPGGELHFYGSVIRALSEPGIAQSAVTAVAARTGGEIHIHGTGIDVISAEGNPVTALNVMDASSSIHANQASYVIRTGTGGTRTRITNSGGTVKAPYHWEAGGTPPDVVSQHGSDTAVITSTTDGQPHLVIYSSACASKWFDTVTGACN